MYYHHRSSWSHPSTPTTASEQNMLSSECYPYSFDSPSGPRDLLLESSSFSENPAYLAIPRSSGSGHLNLQPIRNSHQRFLDRSESNCPPHLTQKQQTRGHKAGRKVQVNRQLLSDLESFHWPECNYDTPIHIHRRTPEFLLHCLMSKISCVHLFMINTESDNSTRKNRRPTPALLQVQAIYNKTFSTVFIIEVQHLPHHSTPLFHSIQQLCQMIFSSTNKIMAWGDVLQELKPFEQFNLFDISRITNKLNLQDYFTLHWNRTHPHTPDCIDRHQPLLEEPIMDDYLECYVLTDDLEDDFDPTYPNDDHNTCICSDDVRPYKMKNPMWGLQKAIHYVFNQALDKSLTINFWSCGLDLKLDTGRSYQDKCTRQSLITYALNDLFAPTNLFFHFDHIQPTPSPIQSIALNTIPTQMQTVQSQSFFILSDSHGKYLPPVLTTSQYTLSNKSVSGLQWINIYNPNLCARSHLLSTSISSTLSSSAGILLFIGTNSVRSTPASQILPQIENIVDFIRSKHPHLSPTQNISIVYAFPCLKTSTRFPSHSSLLENITVYNEGLKELSVRKNFNAVNLNITENHLTADGIHLHHQHQSFLFESIRAWVDAFMQHPAKLRQSHRRSREALARRNKKHLQKRKEKQRTHTLIRSIARVWELKHLKSYLKHKNINYNRLPEVYHHRLRIQFTDLDDHQYAEQTLSTDEFDEDNYHQWISQSISEQ